MSVAAKRKKKEELEIRQVKPLTNAVAEARKLKQNFVR